MEIKLESKELIMILKGLELFKNVNMECREYLFDTLTDYLKSLREIVILHNDILKKAQYEGFLRNEIKQI